MEALNKMKSTFSAKVTIYIAIILVIGASIVPIINGNIIFTNEFGQHHISFESSLKVANNRLIQLDKSDYSIKDFEVITDEEKSLLYIFNLKPQGYIIVSTNYNLPPVIAYSFSNNFQKVDNENDNILMFLKTDMKYRLDNIPNLPVDIIKNRQLLWDEFLTTNTGGLLNKDFQQWPPEGTTSTGGWLETNWHQNAPYNDFCPIDPGNGQRSVAGCPSVAMAQILNYHERINNIAFDDGDDYYHNYYHQYWIDNDHETYDFPSYPELNVYLDTLEDHYSSETPLTNEDKASLTFGCGVAAHQVYHPSGSGTFGVNQAFQAYLRFGYNNIELLYDSDPDLFDELSTDMMNGLPAHLAVVDPPPITVGHNLVVDGYNTDDYYHLNFGWGGAYNGWYLLPDEIPYGLTVIEGLIVIDPVNPPSIESISVTPTVQSPGLYVNISCEVTDQYVDIEAVVTNITRPDSSNTEYVMINIAGSDVYYYNASYSNPGVYHLTIQANNAYGDSAFSSEYSFKIAKCADINNDGTGPDITDLVYLVDYMFQGGPEPPIMCQCDIDGNGVGPDIADLVHLVDYMFQGGPPPGDCCS